MLTGAVGLLTGPDVAFRWSFYLLLALWPISVYLSARMLGAGRPAAAASAAMAPFLVSAAGVGYEQHAYVWTGFGLWTQLWASWTLPLAWGLSWRAIRDGRGYLPAVLLTALTLALHFETGYLALSVLAVWPFIAGRRLVVRLRRAAVLLAGSLLASAWVIVPLLSQRDWAATNEIVRGTALENGYGAGRVLDWLVSGQLLDHDRLPVVTVFAALGFGLAWLAWSSDANARALLGALAVCLLLALGRTTFGSLANLIPGSADLFFRRFMMGVQLAALLLAGRGAAWLAAGGVRLLNARFSRRPPGLSPAVVLVATVAVLAPAWLQLGAYDRHDGAAIATQRRADDTEGAQLDRLIAVIKHNGGGRTYAGMPSNWGQDFTIGAVPVFKYLEMRSIPLLNSRLAPAGDYLRVAYGQSVDREPRLPQPSPATPVGTVLAGSEKLQQGLVAASVRMRRAGAVVLSASFDAGWTATVDGRPQRTEMVAPALVATTVPAGTHRIIFRYRGWQDYPLLFAVGAAALVALAYTDIRRARSPGNARKH